ncbi:MAG TPA: ABC transporter substrate-binding protein [Chloroflexota bacterium]|jgi:ABC-type nitrate/sulfonate/bicarbonate transport system substrate-binding protein|nr:ABC transporter substrate-binding protein [Chloroflexota bacterium]
MRRQAARIGTGASLALLVTLVLACATGGAPAAKPAPAEQVSQPAAAAPAAPTAVPLRKLVLGVPVTPPNMVHLAPYVAHEQGFFRDVGLEVEFKNFEGGVQALRGGIAGGLDVAGTSTDPIIAAVARGASVKVIGTYAPKLSVVMVAQEDIRTAADLRGKKIGIQEVGGFNEVMSRAVLATVGMGPNDVQYVTVSTAGRVPALVSKQIDAAILHIDQYYRAMETNPNFTVVAKLWEVLPRWWYSGYMVTEQQIRQDRQRLVDFETAIIRAGRFMYENRERTIEIGVQHTNQPRHVVERAYDDLAAGGIWAVNDGLSREMIEYTLDKQVELGLLAPDAPKPTYEQLVDRSIAEEALQRLGGPWTGDPRWY